jgi:hypothetical protein
MLVVSHELELKDINVNTLVNIIQFFLLDPLHTEV